MSPGATMERVYAELKARAMGGRFAPGARLDPVLLARDLSSSATPVRDALHRLSGERLIESWHHIGFRQPVHSETDLRDLYAWTALLLGLALRAPSAAAAGLAVPPCSEDYAARVAQLFRTIGMLSDNHELRQAVGNAPHRYDLPLHYNGHIIRQGGALKSHVAARPVLGAADGYQHIWVDAEGALAADQAFLTWMTGDRFYTWRWVPVAGAKLILGEIGANDPDFNLRREPLLIQRVDAAHNLLFAGVLEGHGRYDGAVEQVVASDSQIGSIQTASGDGVDALLIATLKGARVAVAVAYDRDPAKAHSLTVGGARIAWKGPAARILLSEAAR